MKLKFSALILTFALSFTCFLLGWLFAVFVLPGQKLQQLTETKQETSLTESPENQDKPFLEEMKNNILFLFNPYKIDAFTKKNTKLEQESSLIKKTAPSIQIKKDSKLSPSQATKQLQIEETEAIEESTLPLKPPHPELKKIQEGYDKKNRAQLALIEQEQKFFKTTGKFSFMVNVFSDQEKAFKYINQMKKQYPLWSFLIKAYKDHIRIYLGPFPSKKLAEEFKKALPHPSPFSSLEFLEETSL